MPTLTDALRGRDMGFLKMVANAWGLDLNAPDTATALPQVVDGILKHPERDEVLAALPREAQSALQSLLKSEGRLSWALFTRRYAKGQVIRSPVAHGDGNYRCDDETLARLNGDDRVVFGFDQAAEGPVVRTLSREAAR